MIRIGKGGFGSVYCHSGKAIKIIACSDNGINCYNEVCYPQVFQHPNIVSPNYSYMKDSKIHIVMDLATTDLKEWRQHNTPTIHQVLSWIVGILSALVFLHRNDILHCDIKANNILMFPDGEVKLADFSLCRKIGYRNNMHVCTHSHRPPEYWKKDTPSPGVWVDIWALGYTMYYLIKGTPIFPPYTGTRSSGARRKHYNEIYNRWVIDHKRLNKSTDTSRRLLTLMLHPDYKQRPSAESLLSMIMLDNITLRAQVRTGRLIKCDKSTLFNVESIIDNLNIPCKSEISDLALIIMNTVKFLVASDPDLYMSTVVWMASKIILDEPIDTESLGTCKQALLMAEETICTVNSFKFSIL